MPPLSDHPVGGLGRRVRISDPEPSVWIVRLAALAAVVPIVVATIRALADGWLAVGDNANVLIRSQDVLTGHHPLLGTWSSASIAIGEHVNHPGPLLFDLLAIPAKVGGSGGVAVGVAVIGIASIVAIAWFGWRAGGARLACWCLVAASLLTWTMGSELLYDPWNPHVVLLPFLLLLVLVVAMALGDALALPVAVGVASLVVQTHLTYAVLAPALCVVGVILVLRRHGRAATPAIVVAAVVGIACWAQPLVDQVDGQGNLGALLGGVGASDESVGPRLGARIVADVMSTPPWWARSSFEDAFRVPPLQPTHVGGAPNVAGLPSATTAVVTLALLAALVAGAWIMARRRGDRIATALVAVSAVAAVAVTLAVVTQPLSTIGITGHQLRYLWPVAILVTVALLLAASARLPLGAPVVLLGVATVASLPGSGASVGPANDSDVFPVVRSLSRQLGDVELTGPVLYDTTEIRFAEPWTPAVMWALGEHGIDFAVEEEAWVRQLGEGRRHDGDAEERLFLREGEAAEAVPTGARRIAYVAGLDDDERRELRSLARDLADLDVALNAAGRAAHALAPLPFFRDATIDVPGMVESGWLSVFVDAGVLDLPEADRADAERYADLWYRWNRLTVALFAAPIDAQG